MKHIVMFSGGAASSKLAEIVTKEHGEANTILLHTPTYAESKDSDRFRTDICNLLGMQMTEEKDGRSLWQLIDDRNSIPNYFQPFCTQRLKIEQTDKFLRRMEDDFIVHFGYSSHEWNRVQKLYARYLVNGWKCSFEIFERKITDEEIKKEISRKWKICLPETYRYLEHNNCIPCWKGGKGHFERVARYYPEQYLMAMERVERIGYEPFQDMTLRQLWDRVQNSRDMMFENDYGIPCMCAY